VSTLKQNRDSLSQIASLSSRESALYRPVLEDLDMGRRRLQQRGDLYEQGGWWKLRWREDQIDKDGKVKYAWSKPVVIGPAEKSTGMKPFNETQARRLAWENHLSRLDQNNRTPRSVINVRDFVERSFIPEHVAMLKPGGRAHYATLLPIVLSGVPESRKRSRKWLKDEMGKKVPPPDPKRNFGIGDMRLRDVTTEDCQKLVSAAVLRGYSIQYATHVKNVVSAIFEHADSKEWFNGRNPARHIKLPEMVRCELNALTSDQVFALLEAVDPLSRCLILCSVLTSMNIAEVMGLRWRRVNLTDNWATADGESLPPMHIAVREQWYLRQWGSLKRGSRRRNVPVPEELAQALTLLKGRNVFVGPDHPVFSNEHGRPLDDRSILNRRIKPAAKALGITLRGWHDLRRTFSTIGDEVGITAGERQKLMGHADPRMTMHYTKTPTPQAIAALQKMAKLVTGGKPN